MIDVKCMHVLVCMGAALMFCGLMLEYIFKSMWFNY